MLSQKPKIFENLRQIQVQQVVGLDSYETFNCRNCYREIENNNDYKYWYDPNIGFFCLTCLCASTGVYKHLQDIKRFSIGTIPVFKSQDILKTNCITYFSQDKPRKHGIGFADKDIRESTCFILPQKWQWLINERSAYLMHSDCIPIRDRSKKVEASPKPLRETVLT